MKINWIVRFRNATWLTTFIVGLIAVVYQMIEVYSAFKKGVPQQELLVETMKMLVA